MENIIITTNNTSKIKERAAMLAESINNVKNQGIEIFPHEPIEGKIFWSENEG
jgi:inosine/xanthosine triphosphate pyrophosphatase family protein